MTTPHRIDVPTALQIAQIVVVALGVAGLFLAVGRKDPVLEASVQDIAELREIASDLARASVESAMTDRNQDRRLDEIRDRLLRLETAR